MFLAAKESVTKMVIKNDDGPRKSNNIVLIDA